MIKKIMHLTVLFVVWSSHSDLEALNASDKFFVNHGLSDCNGESPRCGYFMDLANQRDNELNYDIPSITFE